ncbi:MAG: chorismate synthase [Endomicrobiales bacterium]|nr:chorismate synthase [Endomicrobiales bacterium]
MRYMTSGESHGKQLTVIIDGIPAGLKLNVEDINKDLERRRGGFGRGERAQRIEKDKAEIVSGVRWGQTIGSPITIVVKNADWENNKKIMSLDAKDLNEKMFLLRPRPGHADLPGAMKFDRGDLRDILERASARETAARVAAGSIFKKLLYELNIKIYSFTREIAGIEASVKDILSHKIISDIEASPVRTPDKTQEKQMMNEITKAKNMGDTLGGVFTVVAKGVPVGLGSHAQWDLKLDARIAQSLVSIQAVKGVEFGIGFEYSSRPGSKAHDEISYSKEKGFTRKTNNAGGFEGGITNGHDIVVSCAVKPIPSLMMPLKSVNIKTKKEEVAEKVRSDVCIVPAVGVIGESVVAYELARAVKEKFGADSVDELKENLNSYLHQIKNF